MYFAVFTENELEKDPLKEVPAEPYELLDKTRYDFSSKQLPEEREAQLESIMNKLRVECQIKGIMVSTCVGQHTPLRSWLSPCFGVCPLQSLLCVPVTSGPPFMTAPLFSCFKSHATHSKAKLSAGSLICFHVFSGPVLHMRYECAQAVCVCKELTPSQ